MVDLKKNSNLIILVSPKRRKNDESVASLGETLNTTDNAMSVDSTLAASQNNFVDSTLGSSQSCQSRGPPHLPLSPVKPSPENSENNLLNSTTY